MPRRTERRLIERPTAEVFGETATGDYLDNEIVHNYRVLRGWTQEIAAEHHGVSVRSWQRYEGEPGHVPRWLTKAIARYARSICVADRRYLSS